MRTFCIVTPVKNGAAYINTTITNIISQKGNFNIRYHIQDGGSTDGTLDIIRTWEHMLTTKSPLVQCQGVEFTWASEKDNGMYDAINKGFNRMKIGKEDIMGWCNADDVYMPMIFDGLNSICNDLKEVSYIAGNWLFYEKNKLFDYHYIRGPYPQEIMQHYCCDGQMWTQPPQPSVFWKGGLWKKAGPLDCNLKYAGDFEYYQRLSVHAPCYYWPLALSISTRHANQLAKKKAPHSEQTLYNIEKNNIFSMSKKILFMKNFWKKRFLPPKGYIIKFKDGKYQIELSHSWPSAWGTGWRHYIFRRIAYSIKASIKKIN